MNAYDKKHAYEFLRNAVMSAIETATEAGVPPAKINELLLDLAGENTVVEAAEKLQPKGGRR